jgi:polyhydroxyalkanoate synthesis regulator phasin
LSRQKQSFVQIQRSQPPQENQEYPMKIKPASTLLPLVTLLVACSQEGAAQAGAPVQERSMDAPSQLSTEQQSKGSPSLTKQTKAIGESAWQTTKEYSQKVYDAAVDSGSEIYESAKQGASDIGDSIADKSRDVYESTKEKAAEVGRSIGDSASEQYESAKKKGSDAMQELMVR